MSSAVMSWKDIATERTKQLAVACDLLETWTAYFGVEMGLRTYYITFDDLIKLKVDTDAHLLALATVDLCG